MISSLLGAVVLCLNVLDTLKALKRPTRRRRAVGEGRDAALTTRRRISTAKREELKALLMLWVSWACISHMLRFTDKYIQPIVPFYDYIKMGIFGYLCLTRSFGGAVLFTRLLKPHFDRYAQSIDLCASLVILLGRWMMQLVVLMTVAPLMDVRERLFGRSSHEARDDEASTAASGPQAPSTPGRPAAPAPAASTTSQKLLAFGRRTPSLSQALDEARAIFADVHTAQVATRQRGAELQVMRARIAVQGRERAAMAGAGANAMAGPSRTEIRKRAAVLRPTASAAEPMEDLEDRLRLDVARKRVAVTGKPAGEGLDQRVKLLSTKRAPPLQHPLPAPTSGVPAVTRPAGSSSHPAQTRDAAPLARRARTRAVSPPEATSAPRKFAVQSSMDAKLVHAIAPVYPALPLDEVPLAPTLATGSHPSSLPTATLAPIPSEDSGSSIERSHPSHISTPSLPGAFRLNHGGPAATRPSSSGSAIIAQTRGIFGPGPGQAHNSPRDSPGAVGGSSIPSHAHADQAPPPPSAPTAQNTSRKRKTPPDATQEEVDRRSMAARRPAPPAKPARGRPDQATSRNASMSDVTYKTRPGKSGAGLELGGSHPQNKRARVARGAAPAASGTAQTASRSADSTLISCQTKTRTGTVLAAGQTSRAASASAVNAPLNRPAIAAAGNLGVGNSQHSGVKTSKRDGGMNATGRNAAQHAAPRLAATQSMPPLPARDVSDFARRNHADAVRPDSHHVSETGGPSDAGTSVPRKWLTSPTPVPEAVMQDPTPNATPRINQAATGTPRRKSRADRLRATASPEMATPRRSSRLAARR